MSVSTLRTGLATALFVVIVSALGYRAYTKTVLPTTPKEFAAVVRSGDSQERREAAIHLGNLGAQAGPDALPALLAGLKDRDAEVRAASASALGTVGREDAAAEAALIESLGDPSEKVRLATAETLGQRPTSKAMARLTDALKDGSVQVRAAAVLALGKIPDLDASTSESIVLLFSDPDPTLRYAVFLVTNERARTSKTVNDPKVKQFERVVLSALKDPTPRLRRTGLRSLGSLPAGSITAADEVALAEVAATADADPQVRTFAVIALGGLPKLVGLKLNDKTISALTAIVPDLVKGVIEGDSYSRGENQNALVTVGTVARTAKFQPDAATAAKIRESLIAALKDPHPGLRPLMLSILPSVAFLTGSSVAFLKETLQPALAEADTGIHNAAVNALKTALDVAGIDDEATGAMALEMLRPSLKDKNPQVRSGVYTALWQSPIARKLGGDPLRAELRETTRGYLEDLKNTDANARELAVWCLSWTDREDSDAALKALQTLKGDKEERVKSRVEKAIKRLEDAKATANWPEPSWEPFRTRPARPSVAGGGGGPPPGQSKGVPLPR